MELRPYTLDEMRFAYCYHVFLHWRTHRRRAFAALSALDRATLHTLVEPLGIHVLQCDSQPSENRVLVSLRPEESLSACASKLKGQVSKWLRQRLEQEPSTLLARGYFACTAGDTTALKVEAYLDSQAEHHDYDQHRLPPVFVRTYEPDPQTPPWWHADHACTHLQFHVVLSTLGRRGVFGPHEASAVAEHWLGVQHEERFVLRKVSFVPDHVHTALWLHPAVPPGKLIVRLMNQGQALLGARFAEALVGANVSRVWQASAYLGSYGDLATAQVKKYLARWQAQD